MTTSEPQSTGGEENPDHALMPLPEGFPANRSARRVYNSRRRTLGGYGRPWPTSSKPSDPPGSSERTCPVCSISDSKTSSLTFEGLGTNAERESSVLVPWVRHTHDPGCSLWLTPLASLATRGAIRIDPLGAARLARRAQKSGALSLNDQIGGRPNPEWLEWLMGFPRGWTELPPEETESTRSETPLSPRSPSTSAD